MKTTAPQSRRIGTPTVLLCATLKRLESRPHLNRQSEHLAVRIRAELEWRATTALAAA